MKRFSIFLLVSAALVAAWTPSSPAETPGVSLYGSCIVADLNTNGAPNGSAADLSKWLAQMTSVKFPISGTPTNAAIYVVRTNSTMAAAKDIERLKGKGPEGFLLRSEGSTNLWIVGNSEPALVQGVYHYLDRLGCRWFIPNDHWTIIPARKSIQMDIDKVESPAFRARSFFGTGGFGGKLAVDPKMELQSRWLTWQARNWFGGDMVIGGHTGEAFNTAHKAELLAHPEYLAEIGGKRAPWALGTKMCVSNPEVVQMYINDRLAWLDRILTKYPESPNAFGVSVEPADGGGYCTCEKCRAIGSVSDQIFYLANAVARAVGAKYPGKKVSLLAYGEHAGVPAIGIESNVFVLVIPYAFQRTGFSGDELLEEWEKKIPELGMYDYWSIPDWANCLPQMSYPLAAQRIRLWNEHHVSMFTGESTFCAGNICLPWYVASRLMWDPKVDAKALAEDFYTKSFGSAVEPMRRMLERWTYGFLMTDNELALSYRDLQAAESLAKDEAVRARVDDFALYVEYLRLWHDYHYQAADHTAATRTLLQYIWRIYDTAMVQTYRMHVLIANRYEKGPAWIAEEFPINNPAAPAWTNRTAVGHAEIEQRIEDGVKKYVPVQYDQRSYSSKLVPLTAPAEEKPLSDQWVQGPEFVGDVTFDFWAPEGTKEVNLQLRCGPRRSWADSPFDRITVTDDQQKVLLQQNIQPDGAYHMFTVPTKTAGIYHLRVMDQKLTFWLRTPAGLRFVINGGFGSPDLSARVYFYVPKGLKQVALYAPAVADFEIRDGAGKLAGAKSKDIIVREVPEGQDGKVWSLQGYKSYSPFYPYNFPARFAFQPGSLLVPEETVTENGAKK